MQAESQILKSTKGAYLTIYLALIFGIVLSLLLALIEGAALGAARLQAEIVADLGLDSVFAEYNRELLDRYGVFFIDTSYGTVNSGVGMVEKHLSDYMSYNLNPTKDKQGLNLFSTYLYLDNPYLEIDKVSYATDDNALVWKSQAITYAKSTIGMEAVYEVGDYFNTSEENELNTLDVISMIKEQKNEITKALSGEEEIEEHFDDEDDDGNSYSKITGVFDDIVGGGILKFAMPSGDKVSDAKVSGGPYYTSRVKSGNINKGNGLHDGADKPDGFMDEIFYTLYLMNTCGTYTTPKDDGLLKYQIEYILFGHDSDELNLKTCVEALFTFRAASNYISIYNDDVKYAEVYTIALAICTLLAVPKLAEPITYLVLGLWAVAESISDINILLDNGKVPLMKESNEWNVSLANLFSLNYKDGRKRDKGLSYDNYLAVLMMFGNEQDKLSRSLDIVEMDMRQTDGNSGFKIDKCIDYMNVKFGFNNGYGHEFLFDKSKCYE
jgi:hypothetical protein